MCVFKEKKRWEEEERIQQFSMAETPPRGFN